MNGSYREHRRVAEAAAREAGDLLLGFVGRARVREKQPGDLVTDADSASQRLIADRILEHFPGHTMLAEEDGVEPDPDNPWRWIVDPLDGTINFAHGFPFWSVSIALEHAGDLVVGVVFHPTTGQMFSASLGDGATLDGAPIAVSRTADLRSSLISNGLPSRFADDADRQLAIMGRLATGTHSIRRTGSAALNLAFVASGAFDVFYATTIHPWDVAAGIVLVREAGGVVTRLEGLDHRLVVGDILATNGLVHRETVEACRRAWPVG